jgi:methylmalonyl-CoA mutase
MRQDRAERIARREIVLTSVTEFPTLDRKNVEVLSPRPATADPGPALSEMMTRLVASRLAEPFERLRDRAGALAAAGKAPTIFLVGLGSQVDFADPAQAAANFFAAGGIALTEALGSQDPATAASSFAASGLSIACIVGADAAIASHAAAMASALKAKGARKIYVIGGRVAAREIDIVLGNDIEMLDVLTDALDACETRSGER